jgi:predicted negative regulator of RcsB-dependent stress response
MSEPTPQTPAAGTAIPSTPLEALESEGWLEQNFKLVVIACVLAVLGMAVYGVVRYRTEAVAREAAMAFTSASTQEEFDAVIAKYSGTTAAGNALLAKAELFWSGNQKDSALAALERFEREFPRHPMIATAALARATSLDAMGEREKAQQAFEDLIRNHPDSHVTPLAEMRLADLLWAQGKVEEANDLYATLPSKYPGTNQPFFEQSQNRLQWLGAKLPVDEVDPPPAPEPDADAPAAPAAGDAAAPGGAATPIPVTVNPDGSVSTPAISIPSPPDSRMKEPAAAAPDAPSPEPVPAAPAAPKPETAPAPESAPKPEEAPAKPEADGAADQPKPGQPADAP